jgi:hypothetical protein
MSSWRFGVIGIAFAVSVHFSVQFYRRRYNLAYKIGYVAKRASKNGHLVKTETEDSTVLIDQIEMIVTRKVSKQNRDEKPNPLKNKKVTFANPFEDTTVQESPLFLKDIGFNEKTNEFTQ